jgi:exopolysaccharide production protein ExoQ
MLIFQMVRLVPFPRLSGRQKVSNAKRHDIYPVSKEWQNSRSHGKLKALRRASVVVKNDKRKIGLKLFGFIPFVTFILMFHNLVSLIITSSSRGRGRGEVEPNIFNRSFWIGLAFVTVVLAVRYRRQLEWQRLKSPLCVSLASFFMFAAASVTWAYSPDLALSRVSVAIIVALTILLPYAQRASEYDTVKWLYRCYALAVFVSALFVANESPRLTASGAVFGYQGYFTFKGSLGQCGAAALLLSLYALRFRGWDRAIAPVVMGISLWLIVVSNSKGALALLLVSPVLAAIVLGISRATKAPLIAACAACLACYFIATLMISDLAGKISYALYGDPTFTGRTFIWQFAEWQMTRSPWLGWGFHSFWLVGSKAPSVVEAPEWISNMTGSHSGYLDVQLETGLIGYSLFLAFLAATLHSIDRVVRQDAMRGWLLLSVAFYVMTTNILETVWLYNDPLWLLFVLVGADALRFSDTGRTSLRGVRQQIKPRARKLLRASA